jgi:hypothetical protein
MFDALLESVCGYYKLGAELENAVVLDLNTSAPAGVAGSPRERFQELLNFW